MTPVSVYLLKVNLLLSVLYLFYFLFLRRETFVKANRIYFLLGIAVSLGLPLFAYTKLVMVKAVPLPDIARLTTVEAETLPAVQTFWETLPAEQIVLGIYAVVTILLLLRLIKRIYNLVQYLKSLPQSPFDKNTLIDSDTREAYSFWKWIILPQNEQVVANSDIIIAHEAVHVRQRHTIDVLIINVLKNILWFNPLLILMQKAINLNLEYIVDQEISKKFDVYQYQMTLIQFEKTKIQPLAMVNSFAFPSLKKRVLMLNTQKSHGMKKLKFALTAPVLAAFFLSFQIKVKAEVLPVIQAQQETVESAVQNDTLKNKKGNTHLKAKAEQQRAEMKAESARQKTKVEVRKKELEKEMESRRAEAEQQRTETKAQLNELQATRKEKLARQKAEMEVHKKELEKELESRHAKAEQQRAEVKAQLNELQATRKEKLARQKAEMEVRKKEMESRRAETEQQRAEMKTYYIELQAERKEESAQKAEAVVKVKHRKEKAKRIQEERKRQMEGALEAQRAEWGENKKSGSGTITRKADGSLKMISDDEVMEITYNEDGKNTFKTKGSTWEVVSHFPPAITSSKVLFIDGKETSWDELEKVKPNNLEHMQIITGEKAVEKYGESGKNGIIEVTTKNKSH